MKKYQTTSVLDHGRVQLIEYMGSDLSVVNAAKSSFGAESEWVVDTSEDTSEDTNENPKQRLSSRDNNLIEFLSLGYRTSEWKNIISTLAQTNSESEIETIILGIRSKSQHWAPFSHPHITFRVKAPIFVVRQLFKHKIGFCESEVSRRYISTTPEYYIPDYWSSRPTNGIKQGSDRNNLIQASDDDRSHIQSMIDKYTQLIESGVCPEQARGFLPIGTYTEWIWTGSLLAFARMYTQRTDEHAQWETQEYARAIGALIRPLFPKSWASLTR